MVWIWIIVAIIVIALISWLLLSRRRNAAGGSGGPARIGRHVASGDRPAGATTAPAAPSAPSAAAAQPVFDQEAPEAAPESAPADVPEAAPETAPADVPEAAPETAPADVPDTAPEADSDDTPTQAAPVVEDQPADRDAEEPVLHTTGSTGEEQLVASGSTGRDADETHRDEIDATVAAENDDPQVRPADAPPENAADGVQHADAELAETPVEEPVEGAVDAGAEAPAPAASAGETAGYAVGGAAPGAEPGTDPMTERFGAGAVSPRADGSAPEGHPIKGNADSMLFHTPDSPRYEATDPAVWFRDAAAATSAGFAHWDRNQRGGAAPAAPSVAEEAVTGADAVAEPPAADAEQPATGAADPMREQFGAGAASPLEDGSAPSDRHTIKGNAETMLFHTPDSPHYERVEAEVWFIDEETAKAAGFQHWDHRER